MSHLINIHINIVPKSDFSKKLKEIFKFAWLQHILVIKCS